MEIGGMVTFAQWLTRWRNLFRLAAQTGVFPLEFFNAVADGFDGAVQLFLRVARGDVLGAVPVEGFDMDKDGAFGSGLFFRHTQGLNQLARRASSSWTSAWPRILRRLCEG